LTLRPIRPVTAKQAGSTSNAESLYGAFVLSVNLDQLFALQKTELFPPHTCLSTYGGSRMLSTAIAMTVIGLKGRADLLQSARRHRRNCREWACSSYIIRHGADKRKFTLATRLARPAARMCDLNLRNLWLLVF
jgi:hypothetical protein